MLVGDFPPGLPVRQTEVDSLTRLLSAGGGGVISVHPPDLQPIRKEVAEHTRTFICLLSLQGGV